MVGAEIRFDGLQAITQIHVNLHKNVKEVNAWCVLYGY